jgi:hypothetical protein
MLTEIKSNIPPKISNLINSENLQVQIKLRNGEPLYVTTEWNDYSVYTWTNGDHYHNQFWIVKLDDEKGRYFRFENKQEISRYLRTGDDSIAGTNTALKVYTNHQWQIEPTSDGYFKIKNRYTKRYLCVGTEKYDDSSRLVYVKSYWCNIELWDIVSFIL